jgi:predicted HicB family RNase H-like nuclease
MKNINIDLEDNLHKKARKTALDSGRTLKQLVIDAINNEVQK